jgi:diaminopimelate epimerase
MTSLTLTKHHGLGNDFLVVFHPAVDDLAALARQLCDRRRGIGADGLLVAETAEGYAARMTLFNADGSRAEMSGNGIRCFAQAVAVRRGDLADQLILTDAGERLVSLQATEDPATLAARVEMGDVSTIDEPEGWAALGCHPDRPVAHVSLGNPHSVVGVDDVTVVDLATLGGQVPHVNLEIIEPGPEPTRSRCVCTSAAPASPRPAAPVPARRRSPPVRGASSPPVGATSSSTWTAGRRR